MSLPQHPDPVVQEVLDIWLARFLAGGIEIGDIERTCARIGTWADWGPRWMETAAVHEDLGERAQAEGRILSALEAFLTASRCYHLGYFLSVNDLDLHRRGLLKMVACHDRVLPYDRPAVEKVTIPFQDTHLVALFSQPQGAGPWPAVIVLPGLDSTKETRHAGRNGFLRRGLAVLSLDGPGQGEVSLRLSLRPDYEVAVAAAIDWLETRDGVDAARIGVSGSSLGGYYAARAAAFEPRVRAAVANCGPFDWGECFGALPIVTREAFRHYSGANSAEEAAAKAATLTLRGARVECPLYVIQGELDPLIPQEQGERIAAIAGGEVVYHLVPGGGHGVNNLRYLAVPLANDWLARHLQMA